MLFLPTIITSRLARRAARRSYIDWSGALSETLGDLSRTSDRDRRAILIEFAADATGELSRLHTECWGREEDADGRPMAVSLSTAASLLRMAAATERAVIGAFPEWIGWDHATIDRAPELREWTLLTATAEPAQRAIHLRNLAALVAEHIDPTAAEALTRLAVSEERLAAADGGWREPWFLPPRLAVLTVFCLLAATVGVPGLAGGERLGLGVAVLVGAYAALWLADRRTDNPNGSSAGRRCDSAPVADHEEPGQ
ncbi:hypothetical protein [Actinomadura sp. NEAU-AAG7]|uniref:hypothetical protein n=1 Tax=Actinomadura sp. NEAU-AAG7 TaxID=2839640 RepID=UPI001BE3F560|nr:hypothetical protein [Actinomadura sp. NEAU-AAG7]MBT2208706.1 hypothetical protein [Actinomadura sp. NEAU-AAG7]